MIFNINSTREHTGSLLVSDYMKERKNNSMFIGGVTEYDVMKVVNNLKKKCPRTVTISI